VEGGADALTTSFEAKGEPMATADEMKAAFAVAGEAMAASIIDAAGIWGDQVLPPEAVAEINPRATGEAWTPQQTVEHAVSSVGFFRMLIASAMEQEAEPPQRTPFSTAGEAGTVLTAAIEATKATLSSVGDGDLAKPAGLPEVSVNYLKSLGIEATANVEGTMQIIAAHLGDHAAQIRKAL
jgi:hypothetical protein